jgi:hypothetical protein
MRKTKPVACAIAVLAALVAAAPAGATHLPGTFAVARTGQLEVSSSVLVGHRDVDMRGGWTHSGIPCTQFRRLIVRVSVEFSPLRGPGPRIVRRTRDTAVRNCAEGGPNVGFTFSARGLGFGCPDGRWRPGHYAFLTTTRHAATGTRAIASLFFMKPGRC